MYFDDVTPHGSTVPTRRSRTGSSGGAGWAYSTRYSRNWQVKKPNQSDLSSTQLTSKPVVSQQACKKRDLIRRIGRTKGRLNSKLHAVCDGLGRPLVMLLLEGQMSDLKGAGLMLPSVPNARELLCDKGYDADWFRAALAERGIQSCIPSKSNRKIQIPYDRSLYRHRHKIENMFGKLKDWRRIHTRYDRCAHTFMSAICIAAIVIFWI